MGGDSDQLLSSTSTDSPTEWSSKEITLDEVGSKIANGSSVYIGSAAATSHSILEAIVDCYKLENIQIVQMVPGGDLPHLSENLDRFRTVSFYSFTKGGYFDATNGGGGRNSNPREGLEDYKPTSLSNIPRLLEEGKLRVDVAVIKVTPPHKGFVSLGLGVESTRDFTRHAKVVIAEVCSNMPWTEGHSKVRAEHIDWWVASSEALKTTHELWPKLFEGQWYPDNVMDQIGREVIKHIPDRSTLRFGVTPLLVCVFKYLHLRTDLGLHTDVLTETLFQLHQKGVITNKYKTIDTGRSVASMAHGTQEMYDFCDRNPVIEFHPCSYVSDPQILGKIDNLVSIVGALKVDMTGQVATDSIAHKFYGGVWSDDDSIRGARFSKGGKPIVVLPSKSLRGRSNIVFSLPPGTGVSITRADVEYVVTEYGTAYLYGKSIRERCMALIEIAHPDFREELLEEAKEHRYLSHTQPGRSFRSNYPAEFECFHTTKNQRKVFVRPIKPIDEDELRNFFHKLSDHSVYLRYFRVMRSMPQRILQKTADVDYSSDMAIVALSPPDNAFQHEIVGIAQWVSDPRPRRNSDGNNGVIPPPPPEIAFQVRDDWHGEGLGSFLFRQIINVARAQGVTKLKADVLADNQGMNAIFQKSGVPFVRRSDFGVISYIFTINPET